MHYRPLGRTGWQVSDISFGAWAIGSAWGHVSDQDSLEALNKAIDCGVNFIDTADVYGDGRSERLIAQLKKQRKEQIIVATKAGRRLPKQTEAGYSRENLTMWIEDSLRNLATDSLDLLQLHCPPTSLYEHSEVFGILDDLVKAGKIRYYGVSVEKVEEALRAIQHPNVRRYRSSLIAFANARRIPSSPKPSDGRWVYWHVCRSQAASSPANSASIQPSQWMTTGISIVTEKPLTWAKPFQAWTTRPASKASRICVNWCRTAFR